MSEVLTNGIKVPDKGSRSWYDDMRGDLVKLDALIGSASGVTVNPIITSGIEIASITINGKSYSLYQQDGDIVVNIKPVSTNEELPILLSKSSEENTDTVDMSVGVTVNPSSNTVTATTFVGALNGNATSATSATKATQDASGNVITDTYATKAENSLKANDSEVVHTSGDETISGTKTFTSDVESKITTYDVTDTPTSNLYRQYLFVDKNDTNLGMLQYASRTTGVRDLALYVNDKDGSAHGINITTDKTVVPNENNSYSLGSSSNWWNSCYVTNVNTSGITTNSPKPLHMVYGSYGVIWRQDGTDLYLLLTNKDDQYGPWNYFRPIRVDLATGTCYINGVVPGASNAIATAFSSSAVNNGSAVAGSKLKVANGGTDGAFTATTETLTGTYRALNTVDANGVGMFVKIV